MLPRSARFALICIGVMLLIPTGSSQGLLTAPIIVMKPGTSPTLSAGGEAWVPGIMEFHSTAAEATRPSGVQITYSLRSLPAWLVASVSPSTDVVVVSPSAGTAWTGASRFTLHLAVSPRAPPGTSVVEIGAFSAGSPLIESARGVATVMVTVLAPATHPNGTVSTYNATAGASFANATQPCNAGTEASTVSVQSTGTAESASDGAALWVLPSGALVGGLAGAWWARKLRRAAASRSSQMV